MNLVYIYEYHEGFSIYLSNRELKEEEIYCDFCNEYDRLIRVCSPEELSRVLEELSDYDILERGYYGESENQDLRSYRPCKFLRVYTNEF